jgi:hypothetical protein
MRILKAPTGYATRRWVLGPSDLGIKNLSTVSGEKRLAPRLKAKAPFVNLPPFEWYAFFRFSTSAGSVTVNVLSAPVRQRSGSQSNREPDLCFYLNTNGKYTTYLLATGTSTPPPQNPPSRV